MKSKLSLIVVVFFLFTSLKGQETNGDDLGTEDIVISNDYQVRINDAQRLKINPFVPGSEVTKPSFSYDVPSRLLELQYPPHPLRPLAMPRLKADKYNNSYIRLGFGSQFMPLAQVVYNDNSNEKVQFGAFYKHLSANGKRENQNFRDNDLGIYAQYFMKNVEVGFDANFTQDADFYYGYNESDTSFTSKEARQSLRTVGGTVYLSNARVNKSSVNFDSKIQFENGNDFFKNKEWFIDFTNAIQKEFGDYHFHFLNVNASSYISNYSPNLKEDVEREIFQIGGNYTYNNNDWKIVGGLNTAIGDVLEEETFNIYPILYLEKGLFKKHIIAYGGWDRNVQINTYNNYLAQNPYISLQDTLSNSRIENRVAGLKGSAKKFSYNLKFNNKVVKSAPLFVNNSADPSRLDIVYESRLNSYNFMVEAGYAWSDKLKSLLVVESNNYQTESELKAWHLPTLQVSFGTTYNLKKKIILRSEIFALGGAFKRNEQMQAEKIKAMVDINLGAEYQFSKYLSFFVSLNNLANMKYERYGNYPTFGFNAMAGAQFSF